MNFNSNIMYKKNLVIAVVLFCVVQLSFAQRGRGYNRMEQIQAERIAFFTERMALTPGEAKVFWPVYNELSAKREKIFMERRTLADNFRNSRESLSEKEVESMADKFIDLQSQESRLAEEYHKKFKSVLPAGKVMILYHTENEFRSYLLRRLSGGGRGQGPKQSETPDL